MRKISVYRCPECRKPFRTLGSWANHMNNAHPEVRPKGYTDQRFFYYILTGKTYGNCIVCKKETEWNEETGKYNRFCSNPKCKEDYRNVFKERMISKYGKITMMDDPEFARKVLTNRKISGSYKFSDGGELSYVGSYEKDFLMMMDKLLNFKSTDIMAPSPHTYYYEYEGEKHYYIPDFFIPNLNLEIEIKQNESTHPKILAVDKVKEQKKDEVMFANKSITYIKLIDKKYEPFMEYLLSLKEQIPEKDINQSESIKQKFAQESMFGDTDLKYKKYSSVFESIVQSEIENREIMESYCNINVSEYDKMMDQYHDFPIDEEKVAIEGAEDFLNDPFVLSAIMVGTPIAISYISTKAIKWWNTKIRPTTAYNKWKSLFVSVKKKGDNYLIKGIDYYDLANRINETYESDKLKKLFNPNYKKFSEFLFNKKQIRRNEMEVKSIAFPSFFCVELQELFAELGEAYNDFCYRKIARLIYENSWLSKADKLDIPLLKTDSLKEELNDKYELLPHQKKFIELWDILKGRLNLRGYILAFGQGLGKTLTATSLSILKNKKKVYIVCPNTLTVNWAEELKLYIRKYSDINLWKEEVGIVGNSKYPVGPKCKYLICNNEALDKLLPLINISGESTMLIVDESQNFRNYNGLRVKQLLDAASKIKAGDILLCSGTPIKAVPNEIVPSLMLIDPLMTDEVAHTYHLAFNIDNTLAAQIVNRRFGMIMYRKTKEELDLPPREVHDFPLQISNPNPYLLSATSEKVNERFMIYYKEKLEKNEELKKKYQSYVERYHRAPQNQYKLYLKKFINTANTDKREFLHELDQIKIEGFVENYVRPYIPEEHKKEFEKLYTDFVMMKQSAMGKAIGEILPPLRAELYTKMFIENQDSILDMIDNHTKKTVIFSMFLPVVNEIDRAINQSKRFKSVKITGSVKDRKAVIDRFKQDPSVKVLVATSQTLGTGVTLIEASQMFFFGPPWRETDFEQCADRIHRIGQTSKVDIFNAILLDSRPNLSSRMTDIMKWSGDMFGSMIKTTDETEIYNGIAQEWNNMIAQEAVAGSFIDSRPYDNPIPTPSPDPEYIPQNVIPSKYEVGPGALLKSDNVVKAMLPCVMDEISGEPSDGTKPVLLPLKKLNNEQNADPNGNYQITDREKAVDRANTILNRFDQYSILSRKKYLTELKSLILKWNIDIDLSKYPKIKRLLFEINSPTTEVYNSGYIFDYYGIAFPGNQSYAMEGRIENPDDLHPVYILLTHSSTLLANIIKKFTGDKYSYAAICFDPSFKEFYTFGRKKSGGGFAIESPYIDFYKERPEVPYGIYCVFVTSAQLKEMKKKLQVFIDNEDKYKYHFAGLIKIAFGKESENDTHYFCSGFVVDILQAGGLSKARSYTLYKPQDLTHLYSSYKIDSGNGLQNIKEELIRKNTKIAKEKYIKRFYK